MIHLFVGGRGRHSPARRGISPLLPIRYWVTRRSPCRLDPTQLQRAALHRRIGPALLRGVDRLLRSSFAQGIPLGGQTVPPSEKGSRRRRRRGQAHNRSGGGGGGG